MTRQRMTEEEWKRLGTVAFEIESSRLEGYFFDVGNQHKDLILAAHRELVWARKVVEAAERLLDIVYDKEYALSFPPCKDILCDFTECVTARNLEAVLAAGEEEKG